MTDCPGAKATSARPAVHSQRLQLIDVNRSRTYPPPVDCIGRLADCVVQQVTDGEPRLRLVAASDQPQVNDDETPADVQPNDL
jgi:hypothetical protein